MTIERSLVKKAIKYADRSQIQSDRIKLLNEKISFLNDRIVSLEAQLKSHSDKDSAQVNIESTYKKEIKNLTDQRNIALSDMEKISKKLRRQKRMTVFSTIGSAVATAAVFIFVIK